MLKKALVAVGTAIGCATAYEIFLIGGRALGSDIECLDKMRKDDGTSRRKERWYQKKKGGKRV